jgi:hypothetical protein
MSVMIVEAITKVFRRWQMNRLVGVKSKRSWSPTLHEFNIGAVMSRSCRGLRAILCHVKIV